MIECRKCLIEVTLPFRDGKVDIEDCIDSLNDIGKYFEESQIKYIGEIDKVVQTEYEEMLEEMRSEGI